MQSRGKRCVIFLLRNALAQGHPRLWQCVPFQARFEASLALLALPETDISCAMPLCDSDQHVSRPAQERRWQQQCQNAMRNEQFAQLENKCVGGAGYGVAHASDARRTCSRGAWLARYSARASWPFSLATSAGVLPVLFRILRSQRDHTSSRAMVK